MKMADQTARDYEVHEAADILKDLLLQRVQQSCLSPTEFPEPDSIWTVENKKLNAKFSEKLNQLRNEGRSPEECETSYAYNIFKSSNNPFIARILSDSLECARQNLAYIGDAERGVYLFMNADVLLDYYLKTNTENEVCVVVFKILKGKSRRVEPQAEGYALPPTPGYESHIPSSPHQGMTTRQKIARSQDLRRKMNIPPSPAPAQLPQHSPVQSSYGMGNMYQQSRGNENQQAVQGHYNQQYHMQQQQAARRQLQQQQLAANHLQQQQRGAPHLQQQQTGAAHVQQQQTDTAPLQQVQTASRHILMQQQQVAPRHLQQHGPGWQPILQQQNHLMMQTNTYIQQQLHMGGGQQMSRHWSSMSNPQPNMNLMNMQQQQLLHRPPMINNNNNNNNGDIPNNQTRAPPGYHHPAVSGGQQNPHVSFRWSSQRPVQTPNHPAQLSGHSQSVTRTSMGQNVAGPHSLGVTYAREAAQRLASSDQVTNPESEPPVGVGMSVQPHRDQTGFVSHNVTDLRRNSEGLVEHRTTPDTPRSLSVQPALPEGQGQAQEVSQGHQVENEQFSSETMDLESEYLMRTMGNIPGAEDATSDPVVKTEPDADSCRRRNKGRIIDTIDLTEEDEVETFDNTASKEVQEEESDGATDMGDEELEQTMTATEAQLVRTNQKMSQARHRALAMHDMNLLPPIWKGFLSWQDSTLDSSQTMHMATCRMFSIDGEEHSVVKSFPRTLSCYFLSEHFIDSSADLINSFPTFIADIEQDSACQIIVQKALSCSLFPMAHCEVNGEKFAFIVKLESIGGEEQKFYCYIVSHVKELFPKYYKMLQVLERQKSRTSSTTSTTEDGSESSSNGREINTRDASSVTKPEVRLPCAKQNPAEPPTVECRTPQHEESQSVNIKKTDAPRAACLYESTALIQPQAREDDIQTEVQNLEEAAACLEKIIQSDSNIQSRTQPQIQNSSGAPPEHTSQGSDNSVSHATLDNQNKDVDTQSTAASYGHSENSILSFRSLVEESINVKSSDIQRNEETQHSQSSSKDSESERADIQCASMATENNQQSVSMCEHSDVTASISTDETILASDQTKSTANEKAANQTSSSTKQTEVVGNKNPEEDEEKKSQNSNNLNIDSMKKGETELCQLPSKQPELCQPLSKQSELCQPLSKQSELCQPLSKQPELCQPLSKQSELCQPLSKQSELCQPLSKQPELCQLPSKQSELCQLPSKQSELCQPLSKQSELCQLPSKQPELCQLPSKQSELCQLPSKQSELCQPISKQSELCQPLSKQSELCQPLSKQPELCQLPSKQSELCQLPSKQSELCQLPSKQSELCQLPSKQPELCQLPSKQSELCQPLSKQSELCQLPSKQSELCQPLSKQSELCQLPSKQPELCQLPSKQSELCQPLSKQSELCQPLSKQSELCQPLSKQPELCQLPSKQSELCQLPSKQSELCQLPSKQSELCQLPSKQPELCQLPSKQSELCQPLSKQSELCQLPSKQSELCQLPSKQSELCQLPSKQSELCQLPSKQSETKSVLTHSANSSPSLGKPADNQNRTDFASQKDRLSVKENFPERHKSHISKQKVQEKKPLSRQYEKFKNMMKKHKRVASAKVQKSLSPKCKTSPKSKFKTSKDGSVDAAAVKRSSPKISHTADSGKKQCLAVPSSHTVKVPAKIYKPGPLSYKQKTVVSLDHKKLVNAKTKDNNSERKKYPKGVNNENKMDIKEKTSEKQAVPDKDEIIEKSMTMSEDVSEESSRKVEDENQPASGDLSQGQGTPQVSSLEKRQMIDEEDCINALKRMKETFANDAESFKTVNDTIRYLEEQLEEAKSSSEGITAKSTDAKKTSEADKESEETSSTARNTVTSKDDAAESEKIQGSDNLHQKKTDGKHLTTGNKPEYNKDAEKLSSKSAQRRKSLEGHHPNTHKLSPQRFFSSDPVSSTDVKPSTSNHTRNKMSEVSMRHPSTTAETKNSFRSFKRSSFFNSPKIKPYLAEGKEPTMSANLKHGSASKTASNFKEYAKTLSLDKKQQQSSDVEKAKFSSRPDFQSKKCRSKSLPGFKSSCSSSPSGNREQSPVNKHPVRDPTKESDKSVSLNDTSKAEMSKSLSVQKTSDRQRSQNNDLPEQATPRKRRVSWEFQHDSIQKHSKVLSTGKEGQHSPDRRQEQGYTVRKGYHNKPATKTTLAEKSGGDILGELMKGMDAMQKLYPKCIPDPAVPIGNPGSVSPSGRPLSSDAAMSPMKSNGSGESVMVPSPISGQRRRSHSGQHAELDRSMSVGSSKGSRIPEHSTPVKPVSSDSHNLTDEMHHKTNELAGQKDSPSKGQTDLTGKHKNEQTIQKEENQLGDKERTEQAHQKCKQTLQQPHTKDVQIKEKDRQSVTQNKEQPKDKERNVEVHQKCKQTMQQPHTKDTQINACQTVTQNETQQKDEERNVEEHHEQSQSKDQAYGKEKKIYSAKDRENWIRVPESKENSQLQYGQKKNEACPEVKPTSDQAGQKNKQLEKEQLKETNEQAHLKKQQIQEQMQSKDSESHKLVHIKGKQTPEKLSQNEEQTNLEGNSQGDPKPKRRNKLSLQKEKKSVISSNLSAPAQKVSKELKTDVNRPGNVQMATTSNERHVKSVTKLTEKTDENSKQIMVKQPETNLAQEEQFQLEHIGSIKPVELDDVNITRTDSAMEKVSSKNQRKEALVKGSQALVGAHSAVASQASLSKQLSPEKSTASEKKVSKSLSTSDTSNKESKQQLEISTKSKASGISNSADSVRDSEDGLKRKTKTVFEIKDVPKAKQDGSQTIQDTNEGTSKTVSEIQDVSEVKQDVSKTTQKTNEGATKTVLEKEGVSEAKQDVSKTTQNKNKGMTKTASEVTETTQNKNKGTTKTISEMQDVSEVKQDVSKTTQKTNEGTTKTVSEIQGVSEAKQDVSKTTRDKNKGMTKTASEIQDVPKAKQDVIKTIQDKNKGTTKTISEIQDVSEVKQDISNTTQKTNEGTTKTVSEIHGVFEAKQDVSKTTQDKNKGTTKTASEIQDVPKAKQDVNKTIQDKNRGTTKTASEIQDIPKAGQNVTETTQNKNKGTTKTISEIQDVPKAKQDVTETTQNKHKGTTKTISEIQDVSEVKQKISKSTQDKNKESGITHKENERKDSTTEFQKEASNEKTSVKLSSKVKSGIKISTQSNEKVNTVTKCKQVKTQMSVVTNKTSSSDPKPEIKFVENSDPSKCIESENVEESEKESSPENLFRSAFEKGKESTFQASKCQEPVVTSDEDPVPKVKKTAHVKDCSNIDNDTHNSKQKVNTSVQKISCSGNINSIKEMEKMTSKETPLSKMDKGETSVKLAKQAVLKKRKPETSTQATMTDKVGLSNKRKTTSDGKAECGPVKRKCISESDTENKTDKGKTSETNSKESSENKGKTSVKSTNVKPQTQYSDQRQKSQVISKMISVQNTDFPKETHAETSIGKPTALPKVVSRPQLTENKTNVSKEQVEKTDLPSEYNIKKSKTPTTISTVTVAAQVHVPSSSKMTPKILKGAIALPKVTPKAINKLPISPKQIHPLSKDIPAAHTECATTLSKASNKLPTEKRQKSPATKTRHEMTKVKPLQEKISETPKTAPEPPQATTLTTKTTFTAAIQVRASSEANSVMSKPTSSPSRKVPATPEKINAAPEEKSTPYKRPEASRVPSEHPAGEKLASETTKSIAEAITETSKPPVPEAVPVSTVEALYAAPINPNPTDSFVADQHSKGSATLESPSKKSDTANVSSEANAQKNDVLTESCSDDLVKKSGSIPPGPTLSPLKPAVRNSTAAKQIVSGHNQAKPLTTKEGFKEEPATSGSDLNSGIPVSTSEPTWKPSTSAVLAVKPLLSQKTKTAGQQQAVTPKTTAKESHATKTKMSIKIYPPKKKQTLDHQSQSTTASMKSKAMDPSAEELKKTTQILSKSDKSDKILECSIPKTQTVTVPEKIPQEHQQIMKSTALNKMAKTVNSALVTAVSVVAKKLEEKKKFSLGAVAAAKLHSRKQGLASSQSNVSKCPSSRLQSTNKNVNSTTCHQASTFLKSAQTVLKPTRQEGDSESCVSESSNAEFMKKSEKTSHQEKDAKVREVKPIPSKENMNQPLIKENFKVTVSKTTSDGDSDYDVKVIMVADSDSDASTSMSRKSKIVVENATTCRIDARKSSKEKSYKQMPSKSSTSSKHHTISGVSSSRPSQSKPSPSKKKESSRNLSIKENPRSRHSPESRRLENDKTLRSASYEHCSKRPRSSRSLSLDRRDRELVKERSEHRARSPARGLSRRKRSSSHSSNSDNSSASPSHSRQRRRSPPRSRSPRSSRSPQRKRNIRRSRSPRRSRTPSNRRSPSFSKRSHRKSSYSRSRSRSVDRKRRYDFLWDVVTASSKKKKTAPCKEETEVATSKTEKPTAKATIFRSTDSPVPSTSSSEEYALVPDAFRLVAAIKAQNYDHEERRLTCELKMSQWQEQYSLLMHLDDDVLKSHSAEKKKEIQKQREQLIRQEWDFVYQKNADRLQLEEDYFSTKAKYDKALKRYNVETRKKRNPCRQCIKQIEDHNCPVTEQKWLVNRLRLSANMREEKMLCLREPASLGQVHEKVPVQWLLPQEALSFKSVEGATLFLKRPFMWENFKTILTLKMDIEDMHRKLEGTLRSNKEKVEEITQWLSWLHFRRFNLLIRFTMKNDYFQLESMNRDLEWAKELLNDMLSMPWSESVASEISFLKEKIHILEVHISAMEDMQKMYNRNTKFGCKDGDTVANQNQEGNASGHHTETKIRQDEKYSAQHHNKSGQGHRHPRDSRALSRNQRYDWGNRSWKGKTSSHEDQGQTSYFGMESERYTNENGDVDYRNHKWNSFPESQDYDYDYDQSQDYHPNEWWY